MTQKAVRRARGYGNIYTPHAGAMIINVQRESGLANRTITVTWRQLRLLRLAGLLAALALVLGTVTWVLLASQAARVPFLTSRVARLQREVQRLYTLHASLTEAERRDDQLQRMLGAAGATGAKDTAAVRHTPVARGDARDSGRTSTLSQ